MQVDVEGMVLEVVRGIDDNLWQCIRQVRL